MGKCVQEFGVSDESPFAPAFDESADSLVDFDSPFLRFFGKFNRFWRLGRGAIFKLDARSFGRGFRRSHFLKTARTHPFFRRLWLCCGFYFFLVFLVHPVTRKWHDALRHIPRAT